MKPLNEFEKSQLCEQVAMMLESAIPLADGFDLLAAQEKDSDYKKSLEEIRDDLTANLTLSQSLKKSNLFDPYMIGMVEVGETSGYLDKVMNQLAVYYTRNHETREKIKNALTYPFILICMMLVVIMLLLFKILPLFEQVLSNMGIGLSNLSITLMTFGRILTVFAMIVLIIAIAILIYCFVSTKTKKYSMINLLDKFIVTRKISYNLALAQFAYCLSLFVNSGYNLNDALKMCQGLCENKTLSPKIDKLANDSETKSFEQALLENPIFSNTYNRLLIIGIKSGHIETAIAKVASAYESEVDISIENFLDMVEPVLVCVMSIIVAIILLAVMLPLTSIMSAL